MTSFSRYTSIGLATLLLACFAWGSVSVNPVHAGPQEAKMAYQSGYTAYRQGRPDVARQYFLQAIQRDPQFADAHYNLGMLSYRQQQWQEAYQFFDRARSLNPSDQNAVYFTGLSLEKLKAFPQAIEILSQVTPSHNMYPEARGKISRMRDVIAMHPEWVKSATGTSYATQTAVNGLKPIANNTAVIARTTSTPQQTALLATNTTPMSNKAPSSNGITTFVKNIPGPSGVVIGTDGNMYVASFSKNTISRVEASGRVVPLVTGMGVNGPVGMVCDPRNGYLYVANYNANNILKISPQGKVAVLASGLKHPYMLSLDSVNGYLFVSESDANTVSRIQVMP
ncbi:MAG: tetratricopeptide repeat protein [Vampirovibrionales bacterium]